MTVQPYPPLVIAACRDTSPLAALHAAIFADGWSRQSIAGLLATPGTAALLAKVDETKVGFAIWRVAGDEGELISVGVLPPWSSRRIGSTVLKAVCAMMKQDDCRTIFLEVGADNNAALRLYFGMGFTEVGRRRQYYKRNNGAHADALSMRLDID